MTIKTWQERIEDNGNIFQIGAAQQAEIAELRAELAEYCKALPAAKPGRTNSGDETGGTVKRFGFNVSNGKSEIIPATNGAYVYYDDYRELYQQLKSQPAPLTVENIRAVNGIVHSDGNIFFTNLAQLNRAIQAAIKGGAT